MEKKKLLVIGFGFFALLIGSVGADEFQWKYVGRQAYTGTPEQAIKKLPLPAEVQSSFLKMVKEPGPAQGVIKKGDRMDAMIFGSGEMSNNVLAAWEDGVNELKSEEWVLTFGDKEYILKRPLTCNNWSIIIRPVVIRSIVPALTPPPAVEYTQLSGPPAQYHTITIRVWNSGGNLAAVPGQQSRDLGAKLRAEAREGKLKPYPGNYTFRVEFRDLDFQSARGKIIYVNNKPFVLPETFSSSNNTILVAVGNGEGFLSIPVDIVTKDTALIMHSPWFKPDLKYPPSGSLKTCALSTAGICGAEVKPGEPSEFYQLATTTGESNYHFAK